MADTAMLLPGFAVVVAEGSESGACIACATERIDRLWSSRRVPPGLDAYADHVVSALREAARADGDTRASMLYEYDFANGFVRSEWLPPRAGCEVCKAGVVPIEVQLRGADPIDIPTHLAEHPFFFRVVEQQRLATEDLGSSGAGVAAARADLTARCEYLERAFSTLHPDRVRVASYRELASPSSPAPARYARYAAFQHDATAFPYPRFDEETRIGWTRAERMTDGASALVPAQYTVFPYERVDGDRFLSDWNTTGLSYGPDRRFAETGGLLEVLERDAIAITWLNRMPRARIRYPRFEQAMAPGVELYFIDITTDTPVSAVLCLTVRRSGGPILAMSASCALDPQGAIEKAFSENLMCVELAEYLRLYEEAPVELDGYEAHASRYAHGDAETIAPLGFLLESGRDVGFEAWAAAHPAIAFEDLVQRLDGLGMTPYSVDLTPPWMQPGQAINRVLIPEAIPLHAHHDRPFLGGARLASVPQALGYEPFDLRQGVIPHALP